MSNNIDIAGDILLGISDIDDVDVLNSILEILDDLECPICFNMINKHDILPLQCCKGNICKMCYDSILGDTCPFCRSHLQDKCKLQHLRRNLITRSYLRKHNIILSNNSHHIQYYIE